jgi:hypothetical protein
LKAVEGFEKLGSPKPASCETGHNKHECPSHMLCLAPNYTDAGHCVCDRFFGFTGPQCRGRSKAAWLLLAFCAILSFFAVWALLSNIILALELKKTGRLKLNCIGRTLLFNTFTPIAFLSHYVGIIAMLLELDPDMKFQEHGLRVVISAIFFFLILDSLSVSVVWVIEVQKATAMRARASRWLRAIGQQQERMYLACLYVVSLSAASLVVIFLVNSATPIRYVTIVGLFYTLCIGASYHYAGRSVLAHLHVADEHMLAAQSNYTSMVANIRNTSKTMTRLAFGILVGFGGCTLTLQSSAPLYPAQNSLPRVLQGQIPFFTLNACSLGIVFHIVAYMRYSGHKQSSSQVKFVDHNNLSFDLESNSPPSSGPGSSSRVSPDTNDGHKHQRWGLGRGGQSDDSSSSVKWGLDDVNEGWLTELKSTDKKAKDKGNCRDTTRAKNLQGGIAAGVKSHYSRRQRASLPTHQVHLEKVLESNKEGALPEVKEGGGSYFGAASHGAIARSPITTRGAKTKQSSGNSSSSSSSRTQGSFGNLALEENGSEQAAGAALISDI